MAGWIDRHNALTARKWADLLLKRSSKAASLLVADARRLQRQQEELLRELLEDLGKARRRLAACVERGDAPSECLSNVDAAVRLLEDLAAAKRRDGHPGPQQEKALSEFVAACRLLTLPGPRRRKKLERLLETAHFGALARSACRERLDGTRVVLSSSDIQRFMALHMDDRLCRYRLDALAEAGLLETELRADEQYPSERLFWSTERLEAAVAAGLEALRGGLAGGADGGLLP